MTRIATDPSGADLCGLRMANRAARRSNPKFPRRLWLLVFAPADHPISTTRSPDEFMLRWRLFNPRLQRIRLASAVEVPTSQRKRGRLLRILGFGFGLAIIVGNTIGVGILRTPGDVATQLPNRGLFLSVWIAGGVFTFLAAMNITE